MGLTLGEGGMASPNLGVLVPLFCRPPGIGGRSNGAGEDILGCGLESIVFEVFKISAFFPTSVSERHAEEKPSNSHEIAIHVELRQQGLDLLVELYSPPPALHRSRYSLGRNSDLASALPSTAAADRPVGVNEVYGVVVRPRIVI